jgi:hypothetical protein
MLLYLCGHQADNCQAYNEEGTEYYQAAEQMKKVISEIFDDISDHGITSSSKPGAEDS